MRDIFIGFLLIFLNFDLNLGNSKIGLIPDFIGYIVLIKGLEGMAEESPLFMKVRPYAVGMSVYAGILYLLDLLGASGNFGALAYILAVLSTVVSLYISYNIVMGVRETEKKYGAPLNGDSLKSTWNVLAVFNILTFVSLMIPAVAVICIVISFIVAIFFLVAFNTSKKLYYEAKAREGPRPDRDGRL